MRVDGRTYTFHTDHLGTPLLLTDCTGRKVWSAVYSAFGRARVEGVLEQPLRFPGQYQDEETGLLYNRYRYYSPELGRYLSRDPLSFQAGLNLYLYAHNDPINGMDPLGLWSWKGVLSVVAGVAAAAAVVALAPVAAPLLAVAAAAVAVGAAVGFGLNRALEGGAFCLQCFLKGALEGLLYAAGAIVLIAGTAYFSAAAAAILGASLMVVGTVGLWKGHPEGSTHDRAQEAGGRSLEQGGVQSDSRPASGMD
jgi:RHS repeat-associated protein